MYVCVFIYKIRLSTFYVLSQTLEKKYEKQIYIALQS